jgi:hypothetical protein
VLTEFGLKIAPSTYYAPLTRPRSARAVRDEELMGMIDEIYRENYDDGLDALRHRHPGCAVSRATVACPGAPRSRWSCPRLLFVALP